MKSSRLNAGLIAGLCLLGLASAQLTFADDTPFAKSSSAFFKETETFTKESNLLIDNTQEVDNTLLNLENALTIPHKVATALKQLNETLALIKEMVVIAKQVPQTRDAAQTLETNLDAIKKPVAEAADKSAKLDQAVEPVRKATGKAESAAETTLNYENKFRTAALAYINMIELLSPCAESKPNIEPQAIKILDNSTSTFNKIDTGLIQVNQKYAATVSMPEKALKATISQVQEEIKQLEQILNAVDGLQGQLHPLNDALADLKKVMDQQVGFDFEYPCGSKMCSQSTPYPCGAKMCKGKFGVKYPCGTEMCHKEVPFPCGVKMCSEKLHLSVSTVINGADAIEHKIESLLSSTAWQALKTIGVKKYVDDLQKQAESLTKSVTGKLHLNISTKLPDMNFKLNAAILATLTQQLNKFADVIPPIGLGIDINSPSFASEFSKLTAMEKDFPKLGCQGAPAKPMPAAPKRVNWKNAGLK